MSGVRSEEGKFGIVAKSSKYPGTPIRIGTAPKPQAGQHSHWEPRGMAPSSGPSDSRFFRGPDPAPPANPSEHLGSMCRVAYAGLPHSRCLHLWTHG